MHLLSLLWINAKGHRLNPARILIKKSDHFTATINHYCFVLIFPKARSKHSLWMFVEWNKSKSRPLSILVLLVFRNRELHLKTILKYFGIQRNLITTSKPISYWNDMNSFLKYMIIWEGFLNIMFNKKSMHKMSNH